MRERIVVIGMEAISPLGNTMRESWEALIAGKSGIDFINPPELADPRIKIAGQVKNFNPLDHLSAEKLDSFHRSHIFSLVAGRGALQNAGLVTYEDGQPHIKGINSDDIGIVIGTGIGGCGTIAEIHALTNAGKCHFIDPLAVQRLLPEAVSTNLTMDLGITGEAYSISAACATGNVSITEAFTKLTNKLTRGDLKVMLAGGSEAAIIPEGMGAFAAQRMLSKIKDPQTASRPFCRGKNGFVMSEGSTVLALALEGFALSLGLPILAEVAGFGNTSDAKDKFFPSGVGGLKAMRKACEMAKIKPQHIDHISLHGTSTAADELEADICIELIGRDNLDRVSMSATKSAHGHMLGATAAFEAATCVMAINEGIVPPTINLTDPTRTDIDLVPNVARRKRVDIVMNNAFGLNGINSVVIFRRYRPRTSRTFANVKVAA